MDETVRYTYRLRPGATARATLLAEWGRCRWLWNEAVHQHRTGRRPTFGKLSKLLTGARARSSWLREGSQVAQQQTLRTYALALQHSFRVKGRGGPRPKRRKDTLPSLEYTTRGFSIRELRLPGGVIIPVVWSRELPSDPTSVRVYQDTLGHWYASFVVHRDTTPAPDADGAIGVDWGVTTTATTTDPAYDLPYLGHRKRCAAELARLQRRMARRRRAKGVKPSNGYLRARRQAARVARRAARQNAHDARVWAKKVVDNHATIAVEDFKPTFLARSRMARKAADAAIGAAKRELINRGTRAGRKVMLVPPAYTTMTCSQCGTRAKHRLGLGVRVFRCDTCGHTACRDRNAARVILTMAERDRAGADDVRHAITSFRDGARVRSEPEIPRLPAMGRRYHTTSRAGIGKTSRPPQCRT
ncbi:RNA-guided endonuclease InsQ/TnpB family protein [Plantactinospora sp. CA-294935]|uniref:RNA-guided endonuclease InsQ/TnpB family protein n=1 Tax=Plantactinospora sp. CA-294935 TaxID=3240012 RepID=UPI003D8A12E2